MFSTHTSVLACMRKWRRPAAAILTGIRASDDINRNSSSGAYACEANFSPVTFCCCPSQSCSLVQWPVHLCFAVALRFVSIYGKLMSVTSDRTRCATAVFVLRAERFGHISSLTDRVCLCLVWLVGVNVLRSAPLPSEHIRTKLTVRMCASLLAPLIISLLVHINAFVHTAAVAAMSKHLQSSQFVRALFQSTASR